MSGKIQGHSADDFHSRGNKIDLSKSGYTNAEGEYKVFESFDAEGRPVRVMRDTNGDEYFDVESNFDENGRIAEELINNDSDPELDLYVEYKYENDAEVARHIDSDLDGNTDVTSYLDANGEIIADDIDEDDDGSVDLHVEYEYYENGNEAQRKIDINNDGTVDVISHFDENGKIASEDIDTDNDGKADLHVDYIYDENGNEAQRILDNNGDGLPDFIETLDETGKIVSESSDTDGDGILDTFTDFVYNDAGEIVDKKNRKLTKIEDNTKIPNGCKIEGTRLFNEQGTEIAIVVNVNKNGKNVQQIYLFGKEIPKDDTVTFENGTYTTKDPSGNVLTEDKDTDGDGILDSHIEYSYENGKKTVSRRTNLAPIPADTEIPPNCTVKGNRIFNDEGLQIGIIITTIENGKEVQKMYHINKVFE